ncbi:hypothetical protein HPP92_021771 [Vanilla planifolia]|uniref:Thiaminase-2/PQQC domain-containing protein n=1 Tax=Vanilla planifolia TaxID=51239 RepID=A0A835PWX6_VANPL|nr:hypothetical protein HPP92_021771 [Vanilla planifolia]
MEMVRGAEEPRLLPANRFWFESQKEAILVKCSPFFVCLASGNLQMETFRHYLSQDIHYLRSFVSAYEKAEEYADDDDTRAAIAKMRTAATHDMKSFLFSVGEWGIDPNEEIPCNPATVKYTAFLTAITCGRIEGCVGNIDTPFKKTRLPAYIVGAMAPYMRLNAFLWDDLVPLLMLCGDNNPYSLHLKNFSAAIVQDPAAKNEELLNKLCASLTGEELDIVQKVYQKAMKLEIEFFLSQPLNQPSVVPLLRLHNTKDYFFFFADFDLTCTAVDSSALLAEIVIVNVPKYAKLSSEETSIQPITTSMLRDAWLAISSQYVEEFERCIDGLLPAKGDGAFDLEDLYKRFEQLSEFEKRANTKVINSGLLRGVEVDDITSAGKNMKFFDGCPAFFQKLAGEKERLNAHVYILSYCWCIDLVKSAFSSVRCLDHVTIHSNYLIYENTMTTGGMVRRMETPMDKVKAFKTILTLSEGAKHFSVYVGDTVGDLLCLLEADVGIVVGSSPNLRKVVQRCGISLVPLFQGLVSKQRELDENGSVSWNRRLGVLYSASGWPEIHAFLLGHDGL